VFLSQSPAFTSVSTLASTLVALADTVNIRCKGFIQSVISVIFPMCHDCRFFSAFQMCRRLKFVCKMVLISFLYLFTWENRLLRLNLCHFRKTKVEMLKFAALMAKCLTNNLWKFPPKILNYSENNEIFVGGCFFSRTLYVYLCSNFQEIAMPNA